MSKATNLIKAAKRHDKSTKNGRAAIRLIRGKYSKLFLSCSSDLYDSAVRTFDRTVGFGFGFEH